MAQLPKGLKVKAPSASLFEKMGRPTENLTVSEIKNIVEDFAMASLRSKRAGFDAVEIHAAHGYLLAQFLSPAINQRRDEYGGDAEKRFLILKEVVCKIREYVGSDYPLIVRISGKELIEHGRDLDESCGIAKRLEKIGVDSVHISAGSQIFNDEARAAMVESMEYEQGWRTYMAARVKEKVDIPVIAVGVIRDPAFANGLIRDRKVDFVAVGRGLIADPYWCRKSYMGKTIRRCISCRTCIGERSFGRSISCAVNPEVGWEGGRLNRPVRDPKRKKVIVIGGGPAGLSFSVEARKRGHEVTLFEGENLLGGQLNLAKRLPGKDKISWLVEDLKSEIKDCRVSVVLDSWITFETLASLNGDVLVMAMGSKPVRKLRGVERTPERVFTARDILAKSLKLNNGKIVVVGGGSLGCEIANFLSEGDVQITIMEMSGELGLGMEPLNRILLIKKLNKRGIEIMVKTRVVEIREEEIVFIERGEEKLASFDFLVLALGNQANAALKKGKELGSIFSEIYWIGDCRKPGRIKDAILDGYLTARKL
jgi:thioredoxin reductase